MNGRNQHAVIKNETPPGAAINEPAEEETIAYLTVATAVEPDVLTKRFRLEDSVLRKEGGGILYSGRAAVSCIESLAEFSELLMRLGPNQALIYGLPERDDVGLVTRDMWIRMGEPEDPIPRTKEAFSWSNGPGIMMIDYDPEDDDLPLSANELVSIVRAAVPGLADAEMLTWPSASSWIKNKETDAWMHEAGGLRIYLMVANASDIPRAGKALFDRLWLIGRGYFKISSAGSLLERTLVDAAVWQPNRLDFAAGAQCEAPLEQHRGEPELHEGSMRLVDTTAAIPDLTSREADTVTQFKQAARQKREPEAMSVRNAWLDARAARMAGDEASPEKIAHARGDAERVLETDVLTGGYPISVEVNGEIREVSVQEILDNPGRYDRCRTRDPIEPDYDGGRLVGMLYISGLTGSLHSFARGDRTFRLVRERTVIDILQGRLDEAVSSTIAVLRGHPLFYDFGDTCAYVDNGRVYPLEQHRFDQLVSKLVRFMGRAPKGGPVLKDPPTNLAKRVIAMGTMRGLKQLTGVVTAPTMRLDGTILNGAGYDAETQLYLHLDADTHDINIPEAPTDAEARVALATLMFPFKDFPFTGPEDRGVFLAALLTAIVRRVLPTSPGFGFDAPVQASGKSLLANCVAALAGATPPEVYPPTFGRDDEEIRKRLLSCFRKGTSAVVWDNIVGSFDSASLAAAMTADTYADRVLGHSEIVSVPSRTLMLFTGNNLTFQGDMARRVLTCRIDPGSDTPFQRQFELDPLRYVKEHRLKLVTAALILLSGSYKSSIERPEGRMASFEDWNDLVRNAVCWVNSVIAPGSYHDPMIAVIRAAERDPEVEALASLLNGLHEQFADTEFTSSDVQKLMPRTPHSIAVGTAHGLIEALGGIAEHGKLTSAKLGKLLSYRKDRIAGGLVLRQRKDGHSKTTHWRVEATT